MDGQRVRSWRERGRCTERPERRREMHREGGEKRGQQRHEETATVTHRKIRRDEDKKGRPHLCHRLLPMLR